MFHVKLIIHSYGLASVLGLILQTRIHTPLVALVY